MGLMLVTYDLHQPQRNYDGLIQLLESYESWWHGLESVWLIVTDETAEELRERLREELDVDDSVMVLSVDDRSAAWYNLSEDASQWLDNVL